MARASVAELGNGIRLLIGAINEIVNVIDYYYPVCALSSTNENLITLGVCGLEVMSEPPRDAGECGGRGET